MVVVSSCSMAFTSLTPVVNGTLRLIKGATLSVHVSGESVTKGRALHMMR